MDHIHSSMNNRKVINWFSTLKRATRIEFVCGLLQFCSPVELRFYGSYLEELARNDYSSLRPLELIANSEEPSSAFESFKKALLSAKIPQKFTCLFENKSSINSIILGLSLLRSNNCNLANYYYSCMMADLQSSDVNNANSFTEALISSWEFIDDIILIYSIASYHPAFSHFQKYRLFERLREILYLFLKRERGFNICKFNPDLLENSSLLSFLDEFSKIKSRRSSLPDRNRINSQMKEKKCQVRNLPPHHPRRRAYSENGLMINSKCFLSNFKSGNSLYSSYDSHLKYSFYDRLFSENSSSSPNAIISDHKSSYCTCQTRLTRSSCNDKSFNKYQKSFVNFHSYCPSKISPTLQVDCDAKELSQSNETSSTNSKRYQNSVESCISPPNHGNGENVQIHSGQSSGIPRNSSNIHPRRHSSASSHLSTPPSEEYTLNAPNNYSDSVKKSSNIAPIDPPHVSPTTCFDKTITSSDCRAYEKMISSNSLSINQSCTDTSNNNTLFNASLSPIILHHPTQDQRTAFAQICFISPTSIPTYTPSGLHSLPFETMSYLDQSYQTNGNLFTQSNLYPNTISSPGAMANAAASVPPCSSSTPASSTSSSAITTCPQTSLVQSPLTTGLDQSATTAGPVIFQHPCTFPAQSPFMPFQPLLTPTLPVTTTLSALAPEASLPNNNLSDVNNQIPYPTPKAFNPVDQHQHHHRSMKTPTSQFVITTTESEDTDTDQLKGINNTSPKKTNYPSEGRVSQRTKSDFSDDQQSDHHPLQTIDRSKTSISNFENKRANQSNTEQHSKQKHIITGHNMIQGVEGLLAQAYIGPRIQLEPSRIAYDLNNQNMYYINQLESTPLNPDHGDPSTPNLNNQKEFPELPKPSNDATTSTNIANPLIANKDGKDTATCNTPATMVNPCAGSQMKKSSSQSFPIKSGSSMNPGNRSDSNLPNDKECAMVNDSDFPEILKTSRTDQSHKGTNSSWSSVIGSSSNSNEARTNTRDSLNEAKSGKESPASVNSQSSFSASGSKGSNVCNTTANLQAYAQNLNYPFGLAHLAAGALQQQYALPPHPSWIAAAVSTGQCPPGLNIPTYPAYNGYTNNGQTFLIATPTQFSYNVCPNPAFYPIHHQNPSTQATSNTPNGAYQQPKFPITSTTTAYNTATSANNTTTGKSSKSPPQQHVSATSSPSSSTKESKNSIPSPQDNENRSSSSLNDIDSQSTNGNNNFSNNLAYYNNSLNQSCRYYQANTPATTNGASSNMHQQNGSSSPVCMNGNSVPISANYMPNYYPAPGHPTTPLIYGSPQFYNPFPKPFVYNKNESVRNSNMRNISCYLCGNSGHKASQCVTERLYLPTAQQQLISALSNQQQQQQQQQKQQTNYNNNSAATSSSSGTFTLDFNRAR